VISWERFKASYNYTSFSVTSDPITSTLNCDPRKARADGRCSGETRGLSQGLQNSAEEAHKPTLKKKVRNNSESKYHGCLYQLKKTKHLKRRKKTTTY